MQKTKFLFCHNYYIHPGGESLVFENEHKGLEAHGHAVALYTRSNLETENLSALKRLGVLAAGYYSPRTRREITELVRREQPDVAIVQNVFPLISPSVYTTLAALKVPIIQAVYNYRFICPEGELYTQGKICERCVGGNYLNAVRYRCYRDSAAASAWYASIIGLHRTLRTFRNCIDAFMVPDHFLGKKLAQGGIPAEKIWRNPNPFYASDFSPCDETDGYFLYVGRLVRQKGILTLLEAVCKAGPGVRLVVVGRGEAQADVEQFIAAHHLEERVSLLGPKWGKEVEELIRRSKAVMIPSEWYDNLPLIFCQANACGKPVIASRINGIPEYITEGENGFSFEPGDADELARVVLKVAALSGEDYAALSRSSRKAAEEVFDYSNHYQTLNKIVQSVLR